VYTPPPRPQPPVTPSRRYDDDELDVPDFLK
jgi:hypothetical protein